MSKVTPRINKALMSKFNEKDLVRICLKITSNTFATNQQIKCLTSDGQEIIIKPNQQTNMDVDDGEYKDDSYIEVVGRITEDASIQPFLILNFGNDFDLDNYEKMVQLMYNPKLKDLFY